jgi:hypothetical protein
LFRLFLFWWYIFWFSFASSTYRFLDYEPDCMWKSVF